MKRSSRVSALWTIAVVAAFFLPAGTARTQTHATTQHPGTPASTSFQALASRAKAALDSERTEDAIPLFRQALKLNPRWADGWWSLGTIDYDTDRYAEAAEEFQRVVTLDPRQGTARAMLGLCQFELGQDSDALHNIEASKALGITDDRQLRDVVLYHEGVLFQRAGRFEGAQEALSSLCLSGVSSEELTQTLGMSVLRMRDTKPPAQGSIAADVVTHIGRGACLSGQKNYDAARHEFKAVVANYPDFPYVHYAYGIFLQDARDTAGAIGQFQEQIAITPNDVLPQLRIGAAEYKVDSSAGLPYAEEAVRLAPHLPFAHYLLGLLLLDTGNYKNAIPQLEIARKAFPLEAKIDLSLAAAYAHVGRSEDAAGARAEFLRLSKSARNESQNAIHSQSTYGGSQVEIPGGMAPSAGPSVP